MMFVWPLSKEILIYSYTITHWHKVSYPCSLRVVRLIKISENGIDLTEGARSYPRIGCQFIKRMRGVGVSILIVTMWNCIIWCETNSGQLHIIDRGDMVLQTGNICPKQEGGSRQCLDEVLLTWSDSYSQSHQAADDSHSETLHHLHFEKARFRNYARESSLPKKTNTRLPSGGRCPCKNHSPRFPAGVRYFRVTLISLLVSVRSLYFPGLWIRWSRSSLFRILYKALNIW